MQHAAGCLLFVVGKGESQEQYSFRSQESYVGFCRWPYSFHITPVGFKPR